MCLEDVTQENVCCSAAFLLVYDGRRSISVDGCKRVGQPVVIL